MFIAISSFLFGSKILGQSKAIWFGQEIVLRKVKRFYLIQKRIDWSKMFGFGPLIIGTKAKRFDLVRFLSEQKQNNLIWYENYLIYKIYLIKMASP